MTKTIPEYLLPIKLWLRRNDLEMVVLRRDGQQQYLGFRPRKWRGISRKDASGFYPEASTILPPPVCSNLGPAEFPCELTDCIPPHPRDLDFYLCSIFQVFQRQGISELYLSGQDTAVLDCAALGSLDPEEFEILKQARYHRIKVIKHRLCTAGISTALAGFASALWIYFTSPPDTVDSMGYRIFAGHAYRTMQSERPADALTEMRHTSGAAGMLLTDLRIWFEGIWHGQSLSYTLAFISAGSPSSPTRYPIGYLSLVANQ